MDGITHYNRPRKVEPMQRAHKELGVGTWIAGLAPKPDGPRAGIDFLERKDCRWKRHPIADWGDRDVGHCPANHDPSYHRLWEKGYVSIGDVHGTLPISGEVRKERTRLFGLKWSAGCTSMTSRASWLEEKGAPDRPARHKIEIESAFQQMEKPS